MPYFRPGVTQQQSTGAFVIKINGSTTGIVAPTNYWRTTIHDKIAQINGRVTFTNIGASVGELTLEGLPVTAQGTGTNPGLIQCIGENLLATLNQSPTGAIGEGTSILRFRLALAGAIVVFGNTHMTNTTSLYFSGAIEIA